ncbi:MAG: Glu/Leu/Phe/Val dehydrogenase [Candidatus Binatia bacterium]
MKTGRAKGEGATPSQLCDHVDCDEIGPERIFHYYNAAVGLRAVLVIDVASFGVSAGGVRAAPDLSVREIARLARAMSYKFTLLDLPCGGAKAGIWLAPRDPARHAIVAAFLEAIRPLTAAHAYLPGADLGTSAEDFAGLEAEAGAIHRMGRESADGLPLEEQLTGFGVVVAAKTACQLSGRSLVGSSVAIEGFGKVGAGAARFFRREGARVVAVSTIHGAIFDPAGLDVDELLEMRRKVGDALVNEHPRAQHLSREALFELPVDVLVPGARPDVINDKNVKKIRAGLIVPAANIPYANDAPRQLHDRGVTALPDFVTNTGGVLSGAAALQNLAAAESFALVEQKIDSLVRAVFSAGSHGGGPYEAAAALARERLREATQQGGR